MKRSSRFAAIGGNQLLVAAAIATALLATVVLAGCDRIGVPGGSAGDPSKDASREATTSADLADVQVRDYRGMRLDSIEDFRENSIKGPQYVDAETYRLKILGLVDRPLELRYSEVIDRPLYEKVVRLDCVEGWGVDILWEGVLLGDLLDQARPRPDANTVIFRCADGYSTSLPLEYIRRRNILFAHKINRVTLPAERGFPFHVVAESKWGYKWAKWVTSIELSDDPGFEGYWESRGYDNDADLPSAR